MYSRNFNITKPTDTSEIPENYSGIALSAKEKEEKQDEAPINTPSDNAENFENTNVQETFNFIEREKNDDRQNGQRSNRLFSGILDKFGIKGIESSDITILVIAILLLSGEDEDYTWLLLLLLLIVH